MFDEVRTVNPVANIALSSHVPIRHVSLLCTVSTKIPAEQDVAALRDLVQLDDDDSRKPGDCFNPSNRTMASLTCWGDVYTFAIDADAGH